MRRKEGITTEAEKRVASIMHTEADQFYDKTILTTLKISQGTKDCKQNLVENFGVNFPVLPQCVKAIFISHYKIITRANSQKRGKKSSVSVALFYRWSFAPSSMNGVGDHKDKSGPSFHLRA